MKTSPFLFLLLLFPCSCTSLFGERGDGPQIGAQSRYREPGRLPLPEGNYDPASGSNAPGSISAWRKARGTILRTFAFRALEQGLTEEARNYLSEACEIDPSDTPSHSALARLYLVGGDVRAALAYAQQAIAYNPDDPEINVVYAAALAESDRVPEATRALEKAWSVNPGNPDFARSLLTHYAATGGDELARRFVKKILAEEDGSAPAWAMAGDLALSEGKLDEATEAYRKALAIDPDIPTPDSITDRLGLMDRESDPILTSAHVAETKGDLLGAERLYRFLTGSKPDNLRIKTGLARVLYRQGKPEDALDILSQVPVDVRTWRDHFLQAKIDITLGNWVSARGSLLVCLKLRPGFKAAELLLPFVEKQLGPSMTRNDPAGGQR
ncbi:MAG: tetratricopeptide repeat protein [Planctomycetota bacterium]